LLVLLLFPLSFHLNWPSNCQPSRVCCCPFDFYSVRNPESKFSVGTTLALSRGVVPLTSETLASMKNLRLCELLSPHRFRCMCASSVFNRDRSCHYCSFTTVVSYHVFFS
jgi:hypothetical protein